MMEKSNDENQNPEFKQIIACYTDDEIRNVLKKRKLYQKEAADFAIQEAIRRGIINSEQDLFASEFNHEPHKFSLFPTIENDKARGKFKKSIARSLVILGGLAMVWGGIKIFKTQSFEGILIFVFGVAWSFTSFQLMRLVNTKLVNFMFVLLGIAVAYLVKIFAASSYVKTFDIIFTVVSVGFIFYGIGFLGKLKN